MKCPVDCCKIRQVRRVVGQDITQQLLSAFVLSRLDYCNSLLSGLPRSTIQPLQRMGVDPRKKQGDISSPNESSSHSSPSSTLLFLPFPYPSLPSIFPSNGVFRISVRRGRCAVGVERRGVWWRGFRAGPFPRKKSVIVRKISLGAF